MHRFGRFFGNLKMTTAIAALVLCAIVGSIGAVSTAIYFNLHQASLRNSEAQLSANVGVASTLLERAMIGSEVKWSEAGTIDSFLIWGLMPFDDTKLIDSITRSTKGDASVFEFDKASGSFLVRTTSFVAAGGERATDLVIGPDDAAFAPLMAGQQFIGEASILGAPYLGAYQPMISDNGETAGAVFVGTPMAVVEATATGVLRLILMVGGAVVVVVGAIGLLMSRLITRPIPRLAKAMEQISAGDLETTVPYIARGNEVGGMARAVEVFRENGLRMGQMTEEERVAAVRRREERGDMMVALQAAFGEVVDAAIAGDFTKRVHAEFPDAELNALAGSVNSLVETVDGGLAETGAVLAALADTDLTKRMVGAYSGSFAKLQADTNAVGDKLTEVVTQLRETSRSLKTATGEILAGANDLSERTTRQAATIEETSAAMEQLAATVVENARMAEDAKNKAHAVSQSAERSGSVMSQANAAMERITSSSGKISNIIGLIDDIAFQTNLLALNASVEAARAGDAGKGFAVVAVEVRRLAQSAASASSDVKALIEQSAVEVTGGSKLVSSAAEQLSSMQQAIEENSTLMQRIAKASRDQAAAIDEVSVAVRTMDEMTQHNAALVEQTNAAIEQTEAQATELDRIVDIFTLAKEVQAVRTRQAASMLQDRVGSAPLSYRSLGNAAIAKDWSEF